MKKNKIRLTDLKVTSFVSEPEKLRAGLQRIGGITPDSPYCGYSIDIC